MAKRARGKKEGGGEEGASWGQEVDPRVTAKGQRRDRGGERTWGIELGAGGRREGEGKAYRRHSSDARCQERSQEVVTSSSSSSPASHLRDLTSGPLLLPLDPRLLELTLNPGGLPDPTSQVWRRVYVNPNYCRVPA